MGGCMVISSYPFYRINDAQFHGSRAAEKIGATIESSVIHTSLERSRAVVLEIGAPVDEK